jgi:hypothetical protein
MPTPVWPFLALPCELGIADDADSAIDFVDKASMNLS